MFKILNVTDDDLHFYGDFLTDEKAKEFIDGHYNFIKYEDDIHTVEVYKDGMVEICEYLGYCIL